MINTFIFILSAFIVVSLSRAMSYYGVKVFYSFQNKDYKQAGKELLIIVGLLIILFVFCEYYYFHRTF